MVSWEVLRSRNESNELTPKENRFHVVSLLFGLFSLLICAFSLGGGTGPWSSKFQRERTPISRYWRKKSAEKHAIVETHGDLPIWYLRFEQMM